MDGQDWALIAGAMLLAGSVRLAMHFSFTRRWRAAVDRVDLKTLRKMLRRAKRELPPNLHALLAVELLRLEEDFDAIRDIVDREPLSRYDDESVVVMENARAWALVRLGEAERGLEIATALPTGDDVELTRAVARVALGRAHEALPALERLATLPGSRRTRAERHFFLGEARRAAGRPDAVAAYEAAIAAEPKGPYAARAAPHRGAAAYR